MAESMLENEEFDVVVLGTGLVESIVASDIAAAGKKVLHVDKNPYYGGGYSCFSFSAFMNWATDHRDSRQIPSVDICIGEGEAKLDLSLAEQKSDSSLGEHAELLAAFKDNKQHARAVELLGSIAPYIKNKDQPLSEAAVSSALETLAKLLDADRKYSIELAPKLALCRGTLIDLLIDVGIGEYVEFKGVEHNYLVRDGGVERVPESKEEVFASKSLKLIDKRKLMRLLTTMTDEEEYAGIVAGNADDDFRSFLQSKFKLDGMLLDAVLFAVARAAGSGELNVREGCARIQKYTRSIGRYGRMAYLCSMYGGGSELSQSFCRQCAVSGGTYILEEAVGAIQRTDGKYSIGLSHGTVRAKDIIMNPTYATNAQPSKDTLPVSRSFCIFDKPILGDDTTALLSFVGEVGVVSLLYLTHATMAVPRGQSILYAWTEGTLADKRELLRQATESVRCSGGGAALLSAFFESQPLGAADDGTEGILYTSAPDSSVDFDSTVEQAQAILDTYFRS
ncbi:hypothetical protein GGI12_000662 [Dipsacomyces acuminosporus]|nr:hypothetical protein GGI12_000662 [Dipsacomyces acuminosporus]